MRIGLDYDGTYTAAPSLWKAFIKMALLEGHEVVCVTMRFPQEAIDVPCPVYYTGRRAKVAWAAENGLDIGIWIDDSPHWLLFGAAA